FPLVQSGGSHTLVESEPKNGTVSARIENFSFTAQDVEEKSLSDTDRQRLHASHASLCSTARKTNRHLDTSRNDCSLYCTPSARDSAFGRNLGGWRIGRRAIRCSHWQSILWRINVFPGTRCLQNCTG